ncbi:hypothetical protein [Janthinobacterium sp. RB2P8]|uniref:hypothetical protein n=1 Tax=Janthinobacterium sp. RB2P8 TaxID=3424191 RepID=UPI003F252696
MNAIKLRPLQHPAKDRLEALDHVMEDSIIHSRNNLEGCHSLWQQDDQALLVCFRLIRVEIDDAALDIDLRQYTISKILGHANVQTTQRYAHLQVGAERLALDKLSALVVAK